LRNQGGVKTFLLTNSKYYYTDVSALSINQSIISLITEMSKRTSTCEKHKAVKYT